MADDTGNFEWLLRTTRSVRRRLDFERPVPRDVIEACIEVAVQAPTGARAESWRFLVLDRPEPKRVVAELYARAFDTYAGFRQDAGLEAAKPHVKRMAEDISRYPALVICCALGRPLDDSVSMQVAFYGSILPAAWSLMLAFRGRGIGATWTTLHLLHEAEAAAALGIPQGVTQTVLLPIGYTKEARLRPAERRPASEVTFWNRWGGDD